MQANHSQIPFLTLILKRNNDSKIKRQSAFAVAISNRFLLSVKNFQKMFLATSEKKEPQVCI